MISDERKKARHRNRGARSGIARALIDCPEWLEPLDRVDDFGWLEPVLKLIVAPPGVNRHQVSYSVFVDNTINRHKRFLKPVVRRAHWRRPEEYGIERILRWPLVDISHHTLRSTEHPRLHHLLLNFDRSISTIEFFQAGLITDRSDPIGCTPEGELPEPRYLFIERCNFCEWIQFDLDVYAGKNKELEKAANALAQYIDHLCAQPDLHPYRERYPTDLRDKFKGHSDWFFRPKRPESNVRVIDSDDVRTRILPLRP